MAGHSGVPCYRGPKPQKCPKWLGEGAKGLLDPGSKVRLHWRKRGLHRCKTGFGWCKRLLGDLCSLGPKHLLHPLLTTLGTFGVSGPCSRHSGSQPYSYQVGRHGGVESTFGKYRFCLFIERKNSQQAPKGPPNEDPTQKRTQGECSQILFALPHEAAV